MNILDIFLKSVTDNALCRVMIIVLEDGDSIFTLALEMCLYVLQLCIGTVCMFAANLYSRKVFAHPHPAGTYRCI